MTKEEIKERAKDLSYMVKTPGWSKWLAPHIEEMINKSNNLNDVGLSGTDQEIAYKVKLKRSKHDMYQGLLTKIGAWLKMEDSRGE